MKIRDTKRGFTLIELLIVIAIIGILSATVFASVTAARQKARDAKRVAQIKEMSNAFLLYKDNNNSFPSTTPAGFTGEDAAIQFLVADPSGFLSPLPIPPLGPSPTYIYRGLQGDGTECINTGETCDNFILGITLERDDAPGLLSDADITVTTSNDFYGDSEDCLTSPAGGTEQCYDVKF